MAKTSKKVLARKRRQYKVRKKVLGTAERPRLTVFRSSRHIYAQLINDDFE
jgi:large subunit ribosomal protein L18